MTEELKSVPYQSQINLEKVRVALSSGTLGCNTSRALNGMLSLPHQLIFSFEFLLSLYLGEMPYPNITNQNLLGVLKAGYRMDQPQMCSDEM